MGRLTGVLISCHDREVDAVSSSFTKGAAGVVVGGRSGADEFESTACPSDPNSAGAIVGSLQAFVTRFIWADKESVSVYVRCSLSSS